MSTPPDKPDDTRIRTAYEVASQHWSHAEDERWSILYNFLTANSILLLAWAAIFSSQTPAKTLVLLILSMVGVTISTLWLIIGFRVNTFIRGYGELGEKLEQLLHLGAFGPFYVGEEIRKKERAGGNGCLSAILPSRYFVLVIPGLFAIIYCFLFLLATVSWLISLFLFMVASMSSLLSLLLNIYFCISR